MSDGCGSWWLQSTIESMLVKFAGSLHDSFRHLGGQQSFALGHDASENCAVTSSMASNSTQYGYE